MSVYFTGRLNIYHASNAVPGWREQLPPRYGTGRSIACPYPEFSLGAKTLYPVFLLWHGVCIRSSTDGVRDFDNPAACLVGARFWQGEDMKPLEIAAQFAAFAWYTEHRQTPRRITQAEARRFSKQNWQIFLPMAHEGWGKLLLRVAKARSNSPVPAMVSRPGKRQLSAAV